MHELIVLLLNDGKLMYFQVQHGSQLMVTGHYDFKFFGSDYEHALLVLNVLDFFTHLENPIQLLVVLC